MPLVLSRFGSLVKNENQPSTSFATSGCGSNCAGTFVILLGSRLLAFRNAFQTGSLVACTPIFLPTRSCGLLIGLLARLMMQKGFFWYWAPIATSGAPFRIAALVMSGEEMPT